MCCAVVNTPDDIMELVQIKNWKLDWCFYCPESRHDDKIEAPCTFLADYCCNLVSLWILRSPDLKPSGKEGGPNSPIRVEEELMCKIFIEEWGDNQVDAHQDSETTLYCVHVKIGPAFQSTLWEVCALQILLIIERIEWVVWFRFAFILYRNENVLLSWHFLINERHVWWSCSLYLIRIKHFDSTLTPIFNRWEAIIQNNGAGWQLLHILPHIIF